MDKKCKEFLSLFINACTGINCDGILLSGGLDSSILLHFLRPFYAITVLFDNHYSDSYYSSLIFKRHSGIHYKIFPSKEKIFENIKELVHEYKTFDPIFLKNTVVQQIAFEKAKELQIKTLALGDGADELFSGYNFFLKYMNNPDELEKKSKRLVENMNFVSLALSKKYKIKIFLPFVDEKIIAFARDLSITEKISLFKEKYYGKFFLRNCFKGIIDERIVWRKKEALEKGSGFFSIVKFIDEMIEDEELSNGIKRCKSEKVNIKNKEHLYYYDIYRSFFKPPFEEHICKNSSEIVCQGCNSFFAGNGNYCRTCGFYPINHN